MLASINSQLDIFPSTPSPAMDLGVTYLNNVIGAAIFDLSGLPKEYFTTRESADVSWVQTIFQALGLQSLLMSSLQLEGFRHVIIHGQAYRAIVIKQKTRYIAILVCQTNGVLSESFFKWAYEFEPAELKANSRFNVI
jgi:predicted regulator of Ras-like GTPase activity (Roadblock/LC7/MglB family)